MSSRNVVTDNSSIQCGPTPGHQGPVTVVSPGVLTIGGAAGVIGKAELLAANMKACQNPHLQPPLPECRTVVSVSDGAVSTCLTINGTTNGVVLEASISGQTNAAGTLPIVDAKQDVLTAV